MPTVLRVRGYQTMWKLANDTLHRKGLSKAHTGRVPLCLFTLMYNVYVHCTLLFIVYHRQTSKRPVKNDKMCKNFQAKTGMVNCTNYSYWWEHKLIVLQGICTFDRWMIFPFWQPNSICKS